MSQPSNYNKTYINQEFITKTPQHILLEPDTISRLPPNVHKRKISKTTSSISQPASSKGTLPRREYRIQPHNKHNEKRKLLSYKCSSA